MSRPCSPALGSALACLVLARCCILHPTGSRDSELCTEESLARVGDNLEYAPWACAGGAAPSKSSGSVRDIELHHTRV